MQYLNADIPSDLKQVLAKVIELAIDDFVCGTKPRTGKAIAKELSARGVDSRVGHLKLFKTAYTTTLWGLENNDEARDEARQAAN